MISFQDSGLFTNLNSPGVEKTMSMVFRDDGDHGLVRTKSTPSSDTILAYLKLFVSKWKYSF